ncbi:hypothetical protein [Amphibacillus indicireducens]|uniref:Lipoprotein n=1 Tax=Amphibacillus indicireducens TaxID=1076330 RepID=A0ABP7W2P8_9BACI
MRKSLFLLLLVLMILSLTACYRSEATAPTENTMVVSLMNNAKFAIDQFEIQTIYTGGGMMYADGTNIRKGDIMSMVFTDKEDFDLKGSEAFSFYAVREDGRRISLGHQTLELTPNHGYLFEVRGNTADDAHLVAVESDQ